MALKIYGQKSLKEKNVPQRTYSWSPERRRFVRYVCGWKIKLCELSENASCNTVHAGKCKDLSQGGIKISSFQPLKRHSFTLIEFDPALFSKHIKLETILRITPNRLIAKVVWRHLNLETRIFEAGLEFLLETDREKYKDLIQQAKQIG